MLLRFYWSLINSSYSLPPFLFEISPSVFYPHSSPHSSTLDSSHMWCHFLFNSCYQILPSSNLYQSLCFCHHILSSLSTSLSLEAVILNPLQVPLPVPLPSLLLFPCTLHCFPGLVLLKEFSLLGFLFWRLLSFQRCKSSFDYYSPPLPI